jgi:hypothetical protein
MDEGAAPPALDREAVPWEARRPGVRLNEHLRARLSSSRCSGTPASSAMKDCLEAVGIALPIGAVARLAQV